MEVGVGMIGDTYSDMRTSALGFEPKSRRSHVAMSVNTTNNEVHIVEHHQKPFEFLLHCYAYNF